MHKERLKCLEWSWKLHDAFNLNISFIYFNLEYSGETCLQERLVIHSTGNKTVGRYCGRRYNWSVFASSTKITVEFHTFELSTSQFVFNYQLSNKLTSNIMLSCPHYKDFTDIERYSFLSPFSWIHVYYIKNYTYYTWNVFVPKMFKIFLILPRKKAKMYFYDGPDFHSNHHNVTNMTTFRSISFQIFILYLGHQQDIKLQFNSYKYMNNNYNDSFVKTIILLKDSKSACGHSLNTLCAYNFYVPRNFHVNVTIETLSHSGPNTGYCKYGGLSIYDNVTNITQEVLLLCTPLSTQLKHVIVSSAENLFLILYSYWPYSKIMLNVKIQPSVCKGVHVQR